MEPDIYALSKAGLSKERIEEITRCDDKEIQIIRMMWMLLLQRVLCLMEMGDMVRQSILQI